MSAKGFFHKLGNWEKTKVVNLKSEQSTNIVMYLMKAFLIPVGKKHRSRQRIA